MLIGGWVVFLGLMTLIFGNWEDNKYNPNKSIDGTSTDSEQSITLKRNTFGHYVTYGKINGQRVIFLLDTGATMVAVPEKLANKLRLEQGYSYQVNTANGTANVFSTNIDRLELGPLNMTNIRAAVSPGMNGDEVLLGMSALKQLEFSQIGDELTLIQRFNSN